MTRDAELLACLNRFTSRSEDLLRDSLFAVIQLDKKELVRWRPKNRFYARPDPEN
jgi:hypothetical protein